MERPTGVAVVGSGYWGPAIIRNLASLPVADVRHVVDRDAALAREVAGRLTASAEGHGDYDRALSDPLVRAVVVSTPAASHFDLGLAALRAGKNVLIEKPMAMTVAQCRELEETAADKRLVLMTGHIFLFNAAVAKVKEYIDGGELGDVLYVHSRRVNLGRVQADINALWSFAPHDFSILGHWLGADPVAVAARGFAYVQPGVEDVVFCTVEYPGGVGAHLHMGWLDPRKVREMTVVGSKKMVVFDDVEPQAKVRLYDSSISPIGHAPETYADWAVDVRHGTVSIPQLPWHEPLRREMEHFLACIRDQIPCRTPGVQGSMVTASILAAQESLRRGGQAVTLDEIRARP